MFYIASLKNTTEHHEHIQFWGHDYIGYTPVVGSNIGTYTEEQARKLNDGVNYIAVPVEAVHALLDGVPYYKPNVRLYDQVGPVVENKKRKWNALFKARLTPSADEEVKPKPVTFRGVKCFTYKAVGDSTEA